MADTVAAPNNRAVAFKGKPAREPSAVAKPAAPKKPRVRKAASRALKRGLISPKAAKQHLGEV